jgi:hypothetical protein
VRRFKLAAAITLVVILGGCAVLHHRSAEARTRQYFGMGYFASLEPAAIEAAVLHMVPVGTLEPRVRESLSKAGIGADGMSSYYPPDSDHEAVVRIEFDPVSPVLVKRHFAILMRFDADSGLERVQAKDWLTGL